MLAQLARPGKVRRKTCSTGGPRVLRARGKGSIRLGSGGSLRLEVGSPRHGATPGGGGGGRPCRRQDHLQAALARILSLGWSKQTPH